MEIYFKQMKLKPSLPRIHKQVVRFIEQTKQILDERHSTHGLHNELFQLKSRNIL